MYSAYLGEGLRAKKRNSKNRVPLIGGDEAARTSRLQLQTNTKSGKNDRNKFLQG
jgi:hypothetical protein